MNLFRKQGTLKLCKEHSHKEKRDLKLFLSFTLHTPEAVMEKEVLRFFRWFFRCIHHSVKGRDVSVWDIFDYVRLLPCINK